MADIESPAYHTVERAEVTKVIILGLVLGVLIPLLGMGISSWIIEPIFCQDALDVCGRSEIIGYYISSVLLTIAAVGFLANWGVYRPIIVAFAAMFALWGLKAFIELIASNSLTEYLLISAALFAGVYLLFYWIMRAYSFSLSLILAVLAVVVIRWTLLV